MQSKVFTSILLVGTAVMAFPTDTTLKIPTDWIRPSPNITAIATGSFQHCDKVTHGSCWLPAEPHKPNDSTSSLEKRQWQTPICNMQSPPHAGLNTLCEDIPHYQDLPAAPYGRGTCETWTFNRAVYAVCNYDVCTGVSVNAQDICWLLVNYCAYEQNKGGVVVHQSPTGLALLYTTGGGQGAPPVYSSC